jgi:tetratricopeptide (TPR) repeat protein
MGLSIVVKRVFLLAACTAVTASVSFAQDLGSSNKLFTGSPKTSAATKRTTKKKVTSKASHVAATPKAVEKKSRPAPKAGRNAQAVAQPTTPPKSKFTQFQDVGPTTVTITPPQSKPLSQAESPPVSPSASSNAAYGDLIEEGNAARDARNYTAAEAAYKKARGLKAKDARAIYGLGAIYSDQQRWEDAENAYRAALQIDSGSAITHVALSYVLTQPLAVENLSDRYQEAERLARRAIQQAPSNALAFDQLGVALELRGLIGEETENAYRRAIALDSSFAPAYAHLGRLLRRRGLARESDAAYQTAIDKARDAASKILLAETFQTEQRYPQSEKLLRKALESDPKNQSALLLLGRALITQGSYSGAEQVLRTSLENSPGNFMANSLMGTLYIRQGKFEMAETFLLQASRVVLTLEKRGLAQQFEAVGDGYLKSGKLRNAEKAYRQAITLDNGNDSLSVKLSKAQQG